MFLYILSVALGFAVSWRGIIKVGADLIAEYDDDSKLPIAIACTIWAIASTAIPGVWALALLSSRVRRHLFPEAFSAKVYAWWTSTRLCRWIEEEVFKDLRKIEEVLLRRYNASTVLIFSVSENAARALLLKGFCEAGVSAMSDTEYREGLAAALLTPEVTKLTEQHREAMQNLEARLNSAHATNIRQLGERHTTRAQEDAIRQKIAADTQHKKDLRELEALLNANHKKAMAALKTELETKNAATVNTVKLAFANKLVNGAKKPVTSRRVTPKGQRRATPKTNKNDKGGKGKNGKKK